MTQCAFRCAEAVVCPNMSSWQLCWISWRSFLMLTDSLGSRSLRFVSPLRPKKKKKKCYSWHRITFRSPHSLACACASNPSFPVTQSEVGKWIWRWIWRTLFLFSGVQPGSRTGVNGSSGVQAECAGQRKQHNTMLQFFFYTFSSWIIHSELPDIDTIDSGWRATTAADAGRYVQALSLRTGFYRYFPGRTRC